ncbi:hypothetical protein N3K66_008669 [Trichothecium roseum]|uniref:Uncharacterized protein n=1 Tax=Trichothecium roseum TaxID=47278 RepID=A0ACC0URC6_9HYPO|nr:hypothetical protein N3K66_008669 [Trichothecium roseum]
MGDIAGTVCIQERLLDSIGEAFGQDVITESENQGTRPHLPIYKVTKSRKALFIPFHDSCRAVLCRYMGTEPAELDNQALLETFRSLVGRPHNWRKLCVDYGDISHAHRGLFYLLPGDEYFLYDPLRLSGLEESLRGLPRVSGKGGKKEKGKGKEKPYGTRGDPFAALAPELLLLVLEALPDADAIGGVRRASPAFANLALDASYWRAKLARDMPWLWELGGLFAAADDAGREDPVDWARLYRKMARASDEGARGQRVFGLCNRKRIWEQMCPQFAEKYRAAVRSRNY